MLTESSKEKVLRLFCDDNIGGRDVIHSHDTYLRSGSGWSFSGLRYTWFEIADEVNVVAEFHAMSYLALRTFKLMSLIIGSLSLVAFFSYSLDEKSEVPSRIKLSTASKRCSLLLGSFVGQDSSRLVFRFDNTGRS